MDRRVRVRFAPSPTGGLHVGGVRTALYNYIFAKKHGGDFILRMEDTDQTRYVDGAYEYILATLQWCGIEPDESPFHGGPHSPYFQSERKDTYRHYAERLVKDGNAYYAFDSPEELEELRTRHMTPENPAPQYDYRLRSHMHNSLTLTTEQTDRFIREGKPYVIRIKIPENQSVSFIDMIRGEVSFDTATLDDKVLLKTDGMPTYHLAVVVDDFLMEISHVFRGEEWIPSAPIHVLLWRYLFSGSQMPHWAHLPLILKPDGNGKLSKRDGDRLGFPVYALNWTDPSSGETSNGFKERGFLPEAFINMLAMLGWNDGTAQELFTQAELIEKFHIDRVHKNGAKFSYDKAKWFNHEWIKQSSPERLLEPVKTIFNEKGILITNEDQLKKIIGLVKDRCVLLPDFFEQAAFFYKRPEITDPQPIFNKWSEQKNLFFIQWLNALRLTTDWEHDGIEKEFKEVCAVCQLKAGELMPTLRMMLVGGKFGPGIFDIAVVIGKEETVRRIAHALSLLRP